MREPKRKHFVTFYSPGTLFAEQTTREVGEWDPREACRLARSVKERYGAIPYGFRFETLEAVSAWESPKTVDVSGMYFINGVVETLAEVEARVDPRESNMLSNMRINGYDRVVTTKNGYRWTQPFTAKDRVVNADGVVTVEATEP